MQRKSRYDDRKKVVVLLLIADGECRHYTMIKSLTRLLRSSNSKHKYKQHFCMNFLQGFSYEESRDKDFEYCKDNETVRIEMPRKNSMYQNKHFVHNMLHYQSAHKSIALCDWSGLNM